MNLRYVSALCLCSFCLGSTCHADSLVITYRSGKTQTIPLDDSVQAIGRFEYLTGGSTQSGNGPENSRPPQDSAGTGKPAAQPEAAKKPAPKGGVKFRWAPPTGG